MDSFDEFVKVIARLRAEDGCPWDREQTHATLKAACIEEAAEVVCGINVLEETGNPENLKEELGDLLLQIVMHARIAEEGYHIMDLKSAGADSARTVTLRNKPSTGEWFLWEQTLLAGIREPNEQNVWA